MNIDIKIDDNIDDNSGDFLDESFKEKFNLKKLIIIVSCCILFVVLVIVYARFKATSGLIVHEYKVVDESLPSNFHATKIVQFSDVYFGNTVGVKQLESIVDKINSLNPDIVVFTGDLVSDEVDGDTANNIADLLSKIDSKFGKYSIKGELDGAVYDRIIASSGFISLDGTSSNVYYGSSDSITLTNSLEQVDGFSIYLVHQPDYIDDLSITYNVALSGHSLGGLINLPFIDRLFLPDGAKKYYKGYYPDKNLYVSTGIGTTNFKYRFFNKPSINLYRLTNH